MEKKELYDSLATDCGESVDLNNVTIKDVVEAEKKVKRITNSFLYGDSGPLPGENIDSYLDNLSEVSHSDAMNSMISDAAIMKFKNDEAKAEAERPLTKEEKAAQRKQVCDYLMYQQEQAYFIEHKFIMDGKTKRRVRKMIEKNYDKGKYKPSKSVDLNS